MQEQGQQTRQQLRILTLNVWGLKYVSAKRKERIRAIAEYICGGHHRSASSEHARTPSSTASYASDTPLQQTMSSARNNENKPTASAAGSKSRWDVVCLQEVWCSEDWEYIRNRAKESGSGLIHGRYFWSGALGSGLCILSKYPIVASSTWPYTLSGSPLHVIEGDFFVAKSCGQATLNLGPDVGDVTILNTHFFAPGEGGEEWKRAHRIAQAWELARLANVAAERGQHVIVCGDLNSVPTSLIINLLLSHGQLSDSWSACHPVETLDTSATITAEDAVRVNGITCDNPLNTWSAAKTFSEDVTRAKGKRLDYVFYRRAAGRSMGRREKETTLEPRECSVTANETVSHLGCSLSDHFGVETLFDFVAATSPAADPSEALIPARMPIAQALTLSRAAITIYSGHAEKAAEWQLKLFYLSLLGIPVLSVAASFQPIKWLNWIFVLLGIANGVGGATMLYTGFVGGRWEKSALKNVLADMEIELNRLEDHP